MRRNKRLESRTRMLGSDEVRPGCEFPGCLHPAYVEVEPKRGSFVYWCDVHAEWAWTTRRPPGLP